MSDDLDAIKRIVDAFERSDWSEIDVRAGSLRVHLSTHSDPTLRDIGVDGASVARGSTDEGGNADGASGGPATPPETTASPEIPAGAHVVVSPSPGIFWRSPQPGAPPFADSGQAVVTSTTLCIVEVMKLMNQVKSGVVGTVVGVYVGDGVKVDQGQPLFAIAPGP